jgi:hypothetical protein
MTTEQLIGFLILNFPGIAIFVYAEHKGWLVLGRTHNEQIQALEEEVAFREQLRQEALADKILLQEKLSEQSKALKDLSDVVRQSLDFNERLVDRDIARSPQGTGTSP